MFKELNLSYEINVVYKLESGHQKISPSAFIGSHFDM